MLFVYTVRRRPLAAQALADFPGSAIVVSHDRYFLDRVCSHTLYLEGGGSGAAHFFEGSVSEFSAWRERNSPSDL